MAAKRLELDARNCVVFEDSPSGAVAALAAGALAIAYVPNAQEDGRFPQGCHFIRSMREISGTAFLPAP
jgi:pseudouridine-5'-monophosphatase